MPTPGLTNLGGLYKLLYIMALTYTLLGFLNYGPLTGYELKKLFDSSVAHFWSAELSQIYPTLKQLEAEGLVAMEVEAQDDRPNRKVYSITEDGRRELLEWLASPVALEAAREPLLINVFFAASLPKGDLLAVLRHRAEELERTIKEHGPAPEHSQQFAKAIGLPKDAFFWSLTIEAYLARMKAELTWLREAIGKIEKMNPSSFAVTRSKRGSLDARRAMRILAEHLPGPHNAPRPDNTPPNPRTRAARRRKR